MPIAILGNIAVVEATKPDPSSDAVALNERPDLGNQETTFTIPEGQEFEDQLKLVKTVYLSHHSSQSPAWVYSDDADLELALAKSFDCPVGRPKDWRLGPQEEVE